MLEFLSMISEVIDKFESVIIAIVSMIIAFSLAWVMKFHAETKSEEIFRKNREYYLKRIFILLSDFDINYKKSEKNFKVTNEQNKIVSSKVQDCKIVARTTKIHVDERVITQFRNTQYMFSPYFIVEFLVDVMEYLTQSRNILEYVEKYGPNNVENACSTSLENRKKYALNIIKYIKSNKIRDNSDSHMTQFFELWEE